MEGQFVVASNEAKNAFGDGRCFIEKFVDKIQEIRKVLLNNTVTNLLVLLRHSVTHV